MTTSIPLEKVAHILEGASFHRLPTPFSLAGIKFDVPGAFVGTGISSDLILLVDTASESQLRIQKKIEGIARALDVIGSRRPLTAIVAGPRPRNVALDAMTRVCRVLPIGYTSEAEQDGNILNWLAVLLPLNLPTPRAVAGDTMAGLVSQSASDEIVLELIKSSVGGTRSVEQCLSRLLAQPLEIRDGESLQ